MVASLHGGHLKAVSCRGGEFAWRPLKGGQLSCGQFAAVSCAVLTSQEFLLPIIFLANSF